MNGKPLVLTAEGVLIQGKHYTVSNGFIRSAKGPRHLRYRDLLSAEIVRRRSKRAMYAVLLTACILFAILTAIRSNIRVVDDALKLASSQNLEEAVQTAKRLQEGIQSGALRNAARGVLLVLMILTAAVGLFGAIYLFSGRWVLELTTMEGTFQVPVSRRDPEIQDILSRLRSRLKAVR